LLRTFKRKQTQKGSPREKRGGRKKKRGKKNASTPVNSLFFQKKKGREKQRSERRKKKKRGKKGNVGVRVVLLKFPRGERKKGKGEGSHGCGGQKREEEKGTPFPLREHGRDGREERGGY